MSDNSFNRFLTLTYPNCIFYMEGTDNDIQKNHCFYCILFKYDHFNTFYILLCAEILQLRGHTPEIGTKNNIIYLILNTRNHSSQSILSSHFF